MQPGLGTAVEKLGVLRDEIPIGAVVGVMEKTLFLIRDHVGMLEYMGTRISVIERVSWLQKRRYSMQTHTREGLTFASALSVADSGTPRAGTCPLSGCIDRDTSWNCAR